MEPRFGARAGLAVAALFVAAALAPLVAADHAYSHRYIIFGRLVDANGDPVPNATLALTWKDAFEPESACTGQPGIATEAFGDSLNRPPWFFPQEPVLAYTDQQGLFIYCAHVHAMSRTLPGGANIVVQGTTVSRDIRFDAHTRVSYVTIDLPTVEPNASKEWRDSNFLVFGRLFRPAGGEPFVDNVRVFGDTINRELVNITLTLPNGTTITRNATTNNYGDFAVNLATPSRVTEGTVTVEADGQTFTQQVDGKFGVATFRAEFPKKTDPFVRNLLIVLGVLAAVAVLAGGGWYGYRKMQTSREEQRVRERSQRKRANK